MEPGLQATLDTSLSTYSNHILEVLLSVLPLGIAVVFSVVTLVVGIRWFFSLSGFGRMTPSKEDKTVAGLQSKFYEHEANNRYSNLGKGGW